MIYMYISLSVSVVLLLPVQNVRDLDLSHCLHSDICVPVLLLGVAVPHLLHGGQPGERAGGHVPPPLLCLPLPRPGDAQGQEVLPVPQVGVAVCRHCTNAYMCGTSGLFMLVECVN